MEKLSNSLYFYTWSYFNMKYVSYINLVHISQQKHCQEGHPLVKGNVFLMCCLTHLLP